MDISRKTFFIGSLATAAPGMVNNGHHGGSHPYLTDDFLRAILVPGYKVCVDAATALRGGETLKIPQYRL